MPIRVACPQCSKNLAVKDELAGKRIRCPNCQNVVTIPAATNGAAKPTTPAKPAAGPAKAPAPPAKSAPAKPAAGPAKDASNIKPTPPTKPAAGPAKANVQRKAPAPPPPPAPLEDEDDFADMAPAPVTRGKGKPAIDEDDDFADFADEPAPKKAKGKPAVDEDDDFGDLEDEPAPKKGKGRVRDEEESEDKPAPKKGKKGKGSDKKKKKGSSMMLVLVAVGALLVLGGGAAAAYFLFFNTPNRPVTQLKQPSIPLDDDEEKPAPMPPPMPQAATSHLDLLPADLDVMISVRVADLWSKLPQDLKDKATKAGGTQEDPLQMLKEKADLQPEDVDRVTVAVPAATFLAPEGPKDKALVLVTTTKPVDPQKLQELAKENPMMKLVTVNETTFAVGPEELVQKVSQPAAPTEEGPLAQGIKLAKENHAIVIAGVIPEEARKMATEQPLPPQLQGFLPLAQVQTSTVVIDFDKDLALQVHLNYADEMKAEEANKALMGVLFLGNTMIGGTRTELEKQAATDKSPELQQKLLLVQMGANLLAKVKSQVAGPAVQVDIKIADTDLQQLIQLAPVLMKPTMSKTSAQGGPLPLPKGETEPLPGEPKNPLNPLPEKKEQPPETKDQPKEPPAVLPLDDPKEAPKAQPPAKTPVLPLGDSANPPQARLERLLLDRIVLAWHRVNE
jgi:hypothetical protein